MTIDQLIAMLSVLSAQDRAKDIVNDEDWCDCMEPQVADSICHINIYRTDSE